MKSRTRFLKRLAITGAILAAILAAGAYALLRTPSWYQLPQIAPAERQAVRNNLVRAEQAFTEGLRVGREPFVYHVYQDDVNRWIAMRREIYPLIDELAPPALADPMVIFDNAEITLAGRYRLSGIDVVLSVDVSVAFVSEELILKVVGVRSGTMRVPLDLSTLGMNQRIDRAPGQTWPGSPRITGDFITGLHVGARAWWKNGGVDYRLLGVSVEPGRLNLTVEPLGHHAPSSSKSHDD